MLKLKHAKVKKNILNFLIKVFSFTFPLLPWDIIFILILYFCCKKVKVSNCATFSGLCLWYNKSLISYRNNTA